MKFVVTGASGIQGMSAMIYLLDQPDVTEVRASDAYSLDRLRERADRLNDKRLKWQELNCTDQAAATEAFRGCDVVINTAYSPGGYLRTMRAALDAGCHYMDLTSMGQRDDQLKMHGEFEAKGLTAILDMGTGPGLTELMAVYCMNRLDQTDNIDYYWGIADIVPPQEHTRPLYWGFGFDGIMSLITRPSLIYEDGHLQDIEPRARPVNFRFKDPVGELTVAGLPHPEPLLLSRSFPDVGFKHIMFREGFDNDSARKFEFLRDLGFQPLHEEIEVKGVKVKPFDVLLAMLAKLPAEKLKPPHHISEGNCVVQGWKDGQKREITLMIRTAPGSKMHEHYTGRGATGSYRTGISTAIAAVMLGRGQITKRGVFEPEICVPAEEYIQEQANVGMEVEVTTKTLL